ncbi:MAG: DNA polymerase domain-containing protein [Candidatus Thorarchaeota archaeon]
MSLFNPDFIITYNGDLFDLPYIEGRINKYGISSNLFSITKTNLDKLYYQKSIKSFRMKGRISVDLFYKTWGIHPTSGKKTLGDIAELKLGISKEIRPENFYKIWKEAILDRDIVSRKNLTDYSRRDSELTLLLFKALGMLESLDAIRLVGFPTADGIVTTARNIGEFELFRICKKNNVIIPMVPNKTEIRINEDKKKGDPHRGGLVLEPKGSFYQDVAILDFRSMYPSIIAAYNIGGESYTNSPINNSNSPEKLFSPNPRTSLAEMMDKILEERIKYKKLYQNARNKPDYKPEQLESLERRSTSLKLVLNSTFGSHNYPRGRFFSSKIANAISAIGRLYINWLQLEVNKYNPKFEVIYGDTDSAFIWFKDNSMPEISLSYEKGDNLLKEKAIVKLKAIINHLNSLLKPPMELELQDIAYRIAYKPGRRKAYAYMSALDNQLIIRGFEAVRGDWSTFAREVQTKVLYTLLSIPKGGERKASDVLLSYIRKLEKLPYEELIDQVVIYSPIKRPPKKYKSKPPVIGAFIHYCSKNNLDPETSWKEFDKFPWVIVPGKNILVKRAYHPKYVNKIDRLHYIHEIIRAAERFGISIKYKTLKINQTSLNKFIKEIASDKINNGFKKNNKRRFKSQMRTSWINKYLEKKEKY